MKRNGLRQIFTQFRIKIYPHGCGKVSGNKLVYMFSHTWMTKLYSNVHLLNFTRAHHSFFCNVISF